MVNVETTENLATMKLPEPIRNLFQKIQDRLKRLPELLRDPRVHTLVACILIVSSMVYIALHVILPRVAPGFMLDRRNALAKKLILDAANLTQDAVQNTESPNAYPAAVKAQALTATALELGDAHKLSAALKVDVEEFARYVKGLTT